MYNTLPRFGNNSLSKMYDVPKHEDLLVGIKKHLLIAQDTSTKKETRIKSLQNLGEVLEYVLENIDNVTMHDERVLLEKFFTHLHRKVKRGTVSIHISHVTFTEEIAFISVLQKIAA